ncbi:gamma-interferon inducible lysosomal thiol reductase [Nesidiocoris tenuis]|uniref:Gamma-interferon inducible lysosomal thiol reductase n=1 Tax=Nesidiocoris tenuis TaxID=355587 RepID=A0ABN7AF70_9HEMI|nr:gamma-interferon inducible lysosomal thiol reductase [Nesidiocoris tenuis]
MFLQSILFLTTVSAFAQAHAADSSIKLDVYYESQCPDCYNFFVNQLLQTSVDLSDYIETNLVPYGNAKTNRTADDQITFICQHGESECYLNKIHACALERIKGTNLQRVSLATCLFVYYKTPNKAGKTCSHKFGLKWSDIKNCAENEEGTQLMDKYGKITDSLNPPHTFVPTTAVNKYRGDDAFQDKLASDLKGVLCSILKKDKITPETCNS